jgi:hypothetical protein
LRIIREPSGFRWNARLTAVDRVALSGRMDSILTAQGGQKAISPNKSGWIRFNPSNVAYPTQAGIKRFIAAFPDALTAPIVSASI